MTTIENIEQTTSLPIPQIGGRNRILALIGLVLMSAVWGGTFYMVKDATSHFSIDAFLALRFSIGAVALFPFVLSLRRWPTRAEWRWGSLAGLLFFGGYFLQTSSMRLIDSGRTGFITGLYVILVPLLALVILRYPLKRRILLAALLALFGMIMLSYAPGGNFLGDMIAFGGAVTFAGQIIAIERFPKAANWLVLSFIQATVIAVTSLIVLPLLAFFQGCVTTWCPALTPFADTIPTSLPWMVLGVALFTGLISTAGGLVVQVWAQRILPPSEAALIFALESPFAVFVGTIYGETLSIKGLLGCGFIMAGMLTATINPIANSAVITTEYPLIEN